MKKVVFIALLFAAACGNNKITDKAKPNVIFIMMDDFGYSQIAYNSEQITADDYDPLFLKYTLENSDYDPEKALEFSRMATPTLSKLAKEGMLFTNAFASSNLCAPSRFGIATGLNPNRKGIYRNVDTEALGPAPGSLLVEKLHDSGYATAHIGKWHISQRDQNMIAEYMKKHGIQDSAGIFPPIYRYPEIRKELNRNGYMGSCIPEQNPINNGFDYYYGYNTWESPFYNADNIWEGFQHLPPNPKYNTDLFTDVALGFMEQSLAQKKPFYVQLHMHAVHSPLEPKAPEQYYNRFTSESFILNNFYAHVFAVDENVRRIEEFLKDQGVAENTIIVFTSDNGGSIGGRSTMPGNAPYRGHKGMYFMGGIKVPFFISWPAGIKKSGRNNQLVSTYDILPTVLEAAGIVPPNSIDGKSLLPYLKNTSAKPVHDHLIWSGIHARTWGFMKQNDVYPEARSRDGAPYAWVVIKDNYALRFIAETPKNHYKDEMDGKPAFYELYKIDDDPGERENLITDQPEIVNDLKTLWEKEASEFPAPVKIGRDKWEQIIPRENKFLD